MSAGDDLVSDARALVERRRLRRRLGFWRIAALVAAALAVSAVVWRTMPAGPYVARFAVTGPIFDDADRDRTLRALAKDDAVAAVVLRIDSPGGSVAGSEALYDALRSVAEAKPLVAVMGEAAASGGYIAALAADHLIARGSTLTGSIGVVAEYPNVEKLLDTIGVGVSRVASAPLKAEPSPFRAPTPEALAAQESLIADAYDWFVGLVAERRRITPERARELGDGRVYSGRQARESGLIDALGGEPEARGWLARERDVAETLPTRPVEVEREDDGFGAMFDGARLRALVEGWASSPRLMAILR